MNIAVLSTVPSPYQRDFFQALNELGEVNLTVYYNEATSPDSPWPERELNDYEIVLEGNAYGPITARFHINSFPQDILQADFIILNGYMNNVSQRLLRTSGQKRPPLYFWGERMHSDAKGPKKWLKSFLNKPIKNCHGIIAIGRLAEESYHNFYPNLSVINIPYLCDISAFQKIKPSDKKTNTKTLLFCGQIIKRKGVDLLFQALEQILDSGIDVRLHLIGRKADLDTFLQDLKPSTRNAIDYLGFQAPEDLPKYFAAADVFVLPSRYDGWGVVVNQALAAGLPLVCTDAVGAAHDLIESSKNGVLCAANDSDQLYEALLKILSDPLFLDQAKQHSLELAKSLTPTHGATQLLDYLQQTTATSS